MNETLLMARLPGSSSWFSLPTPSPKNYKSTRVHKERSFEDSNGYFHRDIVRRNRRKVFCGYDGLSGSNTALLDSLYDYDYFYLRFTDTQNVRREIKCYSGPLDGKAAMLNREDLTIKWNTDIQVNFIEY